MDFRMRNLKENKQNYNSMVEFPRNTIDFNNANNHQDLNHPKIKQLQIRLANLTDTLRVESENNSLFFNRLDQRIDQLQRKVPSLDRENSRVYSKNDLKERTSVGAGQELNFFKQTIFGQLAALKDEIRGQNARGHQAQARQGRLQQELREWIGHQKQEINMKLHNQAQEIRGSDLGRQRKYDGQIESLRAALMNLQEETAEKMRMVTGLKQQMAKGIQAVRQQSRGDKESVGRMVKQLKQSFQALKDALVKDRQYVKEVIFEVQATNQDNYNKNTRNLQTVAQSLADRQQKIQKRVVTLRDQWNGFKMSSNQKIQDCKSIIVNVESSILERLQQVKNKQGSSGIEALKENMDQWKKLTQQKNLNVFKQISNAIKMLRMESRKQFDDLSRQQDETTKTIKKIKSSIIDKLEKEMSNISQLTNQQFDVFTSELEQVNDLVALSNKELKASLAREIDVLTETVTSKTSEMQKKTESFDVLVTKSVNDTVITLRTEIKQVEKTVNSQIQSLVGSITQDNQEWAKQINMATSKLKQDFNKQIKLAIENQNKKVTQDTKKIEETVSSIKQTIQTRITYERVQTVKQVTKATEELTAFVNDWVSKGKKQRQTSQNTLNNTLSQQKKTIDKDITDIKAIVEDLKTKTNVKNAQDLKKSTQLKTYVEQSITKITKNSEEQQAKNSKRIDTLKIQLQGKVKATNQKILLDMNTKKDSEVKSREEQSKLKTAEMQKKITDSVVKAKTEVLAQVNKISKNVEETFSKSNTKIQGITTSIKKDMQVEVDKSKKYCTDEITKVKTEIEIKMKAKEEKNMSEINAKRDLQSKQKDDQLKTKLTQIDKKISELTAKTKTEILGEVTRAKTAQLEQLGKIKIDIQGKIKAFQESKMKKQSDSKVKDAELKQKQNDLKIRSAQLDKKIEAAKKDLSKITMDEINKLKTQVQAKIQALNQQIETKMKAMNESTTKCNAQEKVKLNQLSTKLQKTKNDIDKRLAEIKGAAMVNLKAQQQQTNKLLDQKLENLKIYFTQTMQASTGATTAAFQSFDQKLLKADDETKVISLMMKETKDWLNKIQVNVASQRQKNKAVYQKMSSDILDMTDSITVMIAQLKPAQK